MTFSAGAFPRFQPLWAVQNIPTFPVKVTPEGNKKPAVRGYNRVGLKGSADLARKFSSSETFGFMAGRRSAVTVLDIDAREEKVLIAALDRHGTSPLIVRTASGKHHVYYRYSGEPRRIRPWKGLPVDLLGDGVVVAPPSTVEGQGSYQIVEGKLDDLKRLPPIQGLDQKVPVGIGEPPPSVGNRNVSLWRYCMRSARACDNLDQLLMKGREYNMGLTSPLDDTEVIKTAASAWGYTERGSNRFGQHGAWLAVEEIATMIDKQDAFFLLAFLRAHNGPWSHFMCTNGLAEKFGWSRLRLAAARRRLIEMRYIQPVRQAGRGHPALFRWTD
jgi:hypothetical protein